MLIIKATSNHQCDTANNRETRIHHAIVRGLDDERAGRVRTLAKAKEGAAFLRDQLKLSSQVKRNT